MSKTKSKFTHPITLLFSLLLLSLAIMFCSRPQTADLGLHSGDRIVLIGNNLGSRMMNYGHFETELQLRYPESQLIVRNMCDGGNTPSFRPHSGRVSPWAFPGAEIFQTELAQNSGSQGHFETPDEWLTRLEADIIVAFFGYNESFQGPEGLENFKAELDAFIKHTLGQTYNGDTPPRLALVSPIAYEDLSDRFDLPDGKKENQNLALYTQAMQEVATANDVFLSDVYTDTKKWMAEEDALTIDGFQLTDAGYARLAPLLIDKLFGKAKVKAEAHRDLIQETVLEKNWFWHNDFKSPNGVHVFGRRYNPFGPDNYPPELTKIRQMTSIRDTAIWMAARGEKMDLKVADAKTLTLPEIESNYKPSMKNGDPEYLYGQDALDQLQVAPGYKIELFASERAFTDLANPVQISFDNKGRLWVATMPTYPHYKPGDARPNDKLIILEDTDGDGKADKQTIFAENLHLPTGFEFAPEGVYVAQGTNLVLLRDLDGDDKADTKEVILSGFDDHDTHHVISAFCADPSGAIFMGEGVFLHTNVETSYGPVRATNGGFFRYNPQRKHLERHAQISIPNPWGIAFDEWGQHFFAETSGPDVRWMLPGSVKPRYGVANPKGFSIIEKAHRVRPTSGVEFVSSRHFPDEVQGDMLINNTIGFLGTKQHRMVKDGAGFMSKFRQDLLVGDDKNFRPVDMEFAPDGSLYLVDWHNVLIGHMQHNARDPYRDHVHGRIYRITYPSRPLVEPAPIVDASIEQLFQNLELPEYRTRYRSRRELRGRNTSEVTAALDEWIAKLDKASPRYEQLLLEGLWVSWGVNDLNEDLMERLLNAQDYRARAAAVRVLRYMGNQMSDLSDEFRKAARDTSGRVRLEVITAASWLPAKEGLELLNIVEEQALDKWMEPSFKTAVAHLNGRKLADKRKESITTSLQGADRELYTKGKAIFERDGYCTTCHQADGRGLEASGFPPLAKTKWVQGNEERLIKLTLKGLWGPIEVLGKKYPGQVPMTPYAGLLNDEEVAAVLTYVRNSFGNNASVIKPETVKTIRDAIKEKKDFYAPEDLLQQHPHQGELQ